MAVTVTVTLLAPTATGDTDGAGCSAEDRRLVVLSDAVLGLNELGIIGTVTTAPVAVVAVVAMVELP